MMVDGILFLSGAACGIIAYWVTLELTSGWGR